MEINTHNYEEFFLLYIDNELSVSQKAAVDHFIHANPSYKKEFTLLQETKLIPELIELEDKTLLYRLESMEATLNPNFKQGLYRQETKIIKPSFQITRLRALTSIAAILLLWMGYHLIMQQPEMGKQNKYELVSKINKSTSDQIGLVQNKQHDLVIHSNNNSKLINSVLPFSNELANPSQTAFSKPEAQLTITLDNQQIASNPVFDTHEATISNEAIAKLSNTLLEQPSNIEGFNNVEKKESYENLNTENQDTHIYIANFEIDGEKLRGFTRRVNALLRKNKTEKEK